MIAAGFPVRHLEEVYEGKANGAFLPGLAIALKGAKGHARPPFKKHDGLFVDVTRLTPYHRRRAADWGLFNKFVTDGTVYHVTRVAMDINVSAETSIATFFKAADAEAARKKNPRSRVVARPGLIPTKKLENELWVDDIEAGEVEDLLLAVFADQAMHFDGLWHGRSGVLFTSARGNWKRSRR